jgi:hypothetical protein
MMSGLLGRGALVNWGGVLADSEADYNAWHSLQHMPERLSVPGFRRGRRCVAIDGTPDHLKYFMMYEAVDAQVFVSEPYLKRLNDPTPWTQRILSVYVTPSRTVCNVSHTRGCGTGGWLVTLQWGMSAAAPPSAQEAASWIEPVMALPGIIGAHVLEGDATLGQQPTVEKKYRESRGEPDRTVRLAFLIDGLDRDTTQAAHDQVLSRLAADTRAACVPTLFRTQHVLCNTDTGHG